MKKSVIVLCIFVSIFSMAQTGQGNGNRGRQGGGQQTGACLLNYLATTPMEDLSAEENASLLRLRQEEKLARDVYLYFADLYGTRIFSTIARSEQKHMDSVQVLLDRYELADPVIDDTPGQFSSQYFTELYATLTENGSTFEGDALLVGATIEDLDIADLLDGLEVSDNNDIDMVYQNLMKGSRNHLRSFTSLLGRMGETYTAQYLAQDEVDDIVNSPMERGVVYDAEGNELDDCANRRGRGGRGNRN